MKSGSYDRHVRESRSRPRSCLRPTPTIGKRSLPLVQRQRREVMVHPERFERPTLRFVVLWSAFPLVSGIVKRLSRIADFVWGFLTCSSLVFPLLSDRMIDKRLPDGGRRNGGGKKYQDRMSTGMK